MDSDDHSFYVCLYLEGGKPIGHRFGLSTNFPTKLDDPRPKPNVTTSLNISVFRAIFREFVDAMMGYLEYVPLILTLTPFVSHTMVTTALIGFLDRQCVSADNTNSNLMTLLLSGDLMKTSALQPRQAATFLDC
jgi:hypothetical protein